MAARIRNLTHGLLKIKGGNTTELLTVPIQKGDVRFGVKRPAKVIMNRGKVDSLAQGFEVPMEVRFSVEFEEWTGRTLSAPNNTPSVPDALRQKGNAASWHSVQTCGPYVVDLIFVLSNPCSSGDQNETLTFPSFHADSVEFAEGEDTDTLEVMGICNALEPTAVRA